MNRLQWGVLAVLALAGCGRVGEPVPARGTPESPRPAAPATAVGRPAAPGWHGYGGWAFSTPLVRLLEEGARSLDGTLPAASGECQFLQLRGGQVPGLHLMVEGGRFVRYDVAGSALPAPGGGAVGMTRAQLQALYPAMTVSPNKYQHDALDVRVVAPDGQARALVFALGTDGRVAGWRLGQLPQADYVEGCG